MPCLAFIGIEIHSWALKVATKFYNTVQCKAIRFFVHMTLNIKLNNNQLRDAHFENNVGQETQN